MTTIQFAAPAPAAASAAREMGEAAQPNGPADGPLQSRSCRLSLASQVRRLTAVVPWGVRPPPLAMGATLRPLQVVDEEDASGQVGDEAALPADSSPELHDAMEWNAMDGASETPGSARTGPDGSSAGWGWERPGMAPSRLHAKGASLVDAVNAQVDRLPRTLSLEHLSTQVMSHLQSWSIERPPSLVLVGDPGGEVPADSLATLTQAIAAMQALRHFDWPKRLLIRPPVQEWLEVVAACARRWGFQVLEVGSSVDHAVRGATGLVVADWRKIATLHLMHAHDLETIGAVIVTRLESGDTDGARLLAHLLASPAMLKIKLANDGVGLPA